MLVRREVPKKLEMRLKCVRRSYFEKEALLEMEYAVCHETYRNEL
jgi:hypothetical protein